ncbi:MAG TPA: hypothetical protein VFK02_28300 [Kofleriaceae bacterium]|nr:hypothetical protein [Kofleriaceae bacterium]
MLPQLTADELLAGAALTYKVGIPAALLRPDDGSGAAPPPGTLIGEVTVRPLALRDIERVTRAAKEQRLLTSVLMVQQALVAPAMTVDQVGNLPAGVVQFLLQRINTISGLSLDADGLEQAVRAPLSRACFVLAREFGWTPAECAELTVGQVLLYLEMLSRNGTPEEEAR